MPAPSLEGRCRRWLSEGRNPSGRARKRSHSLPIIMWQIQAYRKEGYDTMLTFLSFLLTFSSVLKKRKVHWQGFMEAQLLFHLPLILSSNAKQKSLNLTTSNHLTVEVVYRFVFGSLELISRWVFPKIGLPPKWMVYNGKPDEQMDDLGGPPLFLETPRCHPQKWQQSKQHQGKPWGPEQNDFQVILFWRKPGKHIFVVCCKKSAWFFEGKTEVCWCWWNFFGAKKTSFSWLKEVAQDKNLGTGGFFQHFLYFHPDLWGNDPGGFKYFWNFHPYLGRWSNLTCAYFSNGLGKNHQLETFFFGGCTCLEMVSFFRARHWPVLRMSVLAQPVRWVVSRPLFTVGGILWKVFWDLSGKKGWKFPRLVH